MTEVLALYASPIDVLLHLPAWVGSVVVGLQITAKIGLGGWVLARTGRSPLWILLLLVPYADLIGVWVFAYAVWPAEAFIRAKIAAGEMPPPG